MTFAALTYFTDLQTFLLGVVAVALVGLSKGGLGGAMALIAVPLLAFVMPPMQAAALLLPVLLAMDAISLWAWRGYYDKQLLLDMLPAGILGIAVGASAVSITSDDFVRLVVGLVALLFVIRTAIAARGGTARRAARQNRPLAAVFGTFAGFTSFVAHAGGPPFQVYAMPLRLDPKVFTGTSVIFFSVMNAIKVLPYAALGEFTSRSLWSALTLLPIALVSTFLGAAIVKRMRAEIFYPIMYVMVALVSAKLIYDGVTGMLGWA
ncbi:sulfite exporter TauE/SafE family protein [Primorskyibacter sedentarius]|uniref:Probable membrane transporter protein n=1 Tax=Primorskyibacter sedentarius TaxID=745311 RepID=A0A4R3J959_9RHOB|nr:sulfite exporter TauE/SafE family protein [Primorskyibacter sedentarius]TCS61100.1 hypothetical protein EDD52_11258 [Primorskyibacter sedentarius]